MLPRQGAPPTPPKVILSGTGAPARAVVARVGVVEWPRALLGPAAGPRGHSGGESHGHQELSPRNKVEESLWRFFLAREPIKCSRVLLITAPGQRINLKGTALK